MSKFFRSAKEQQSRYCISGRGGVGSKSVTKFSVGTCYS